MKKFIYFTALLFFSLCVNGQNASFNTYNFGEGLEFVSEDDHSFKLGGYVQPFIESRFIFNDSLDENYNDNRFRLRRLRLRLSGNNTQHNLSYRIQFDLSGVSETGEESSNLLLDAYLTYSFNKRTKLTFGQRSLRSDNRELPMSSASLQLVERSRLTSSFASIRDFGFFLQRDFRFKNGSFLRNYLEITSGDGINNFTKNYGGLKYGGRIDFLPFGLFTNMGQFRQADVMKERSLKLVFGANGSYNQGMSSRRGRLGGDFLFYNINGINTNYRLPNYVKYGADLIIKYKGFSLLAEYVKTQAYIADDITHRNDRYGDDPSLIVSVFETNGIEIDPKDYVRTQLLLGSGINIQSGYLFKNLISIDARYTSITSDELSWLNNGTFYNRPNYYTFGISKYFARNYGFKIQASITYVEVSENSKYNIQTDDPNEYLIIPHQGSELLFRLISSFNF
ncbi:OprO/OprP family phosphate-selective porin [bacterium]|nr:OprO/OprP family phosphate-selective porin [bacterium]